jgi:predicted  nucleic acid-binding Zn-ribbon protein
MATHTPSIIQNIIWPVLMGKCSGCGDRLEFMAGRCTSRSDYKNFQDMEQKLIEWLRENQQKIKDVLAQQKKLNLEVQKMDWRDYDNDVSDMVMKANSAVSKYSNHLCGLIPMLGLANCRDEDIGYGNHIIHILDRLSTLQLPHPEPPTPVKERPATRFPAKEATPERIKESYREQAEWYQWAVDYTGTEAEKARNELSNLQKLIELKELELGGLESDYRSFGDILETYRELSGDAATDPEQQQADCFD